jgi:hypothetical protein
MNDREHANAGPRETDHRIRLRRPWRREPFEGGVRWRRRFGRPTGLRTGDRVWLVIDDAQGPGTVALNGRSLGPLTPDRPAAQFDVTDALGPRNELEILLSIAHAPAEADEPGRVWLSIRSGGTAAR